MFEVLVDDGSSNGWICAFGFGIVDIAIAIGCTVVAIDTF